jgi:hypothetical protein
MFNRPHSEVTREPSPLDNRLLGALPEAACVRLVPDLELVELTLGRVLYEPGSLLRHAYFPTISIVSLLYLMNDGGHGELQLLLLRYTQALVTQMVQRAACNRHHEIEQQFCRLLLLSLEYQRV